MGYRDEEFDAGLRGGAGGLAVAMVVSLALSVAQEARPEWQQASDAEMRSVIPARAPVVQERIETEMRSASGITNGHGKYIAGVVLITAGYSAEGKYSHYFLTQVPLRIGTDTRLAPGEYVLGYEHSDNGLLIHFYEAATGQAGGQCAGHADAGCDAGGIVSHLAAGGANSDSDWTIWFQLSDWELAGMAQTLSQREQKILEALSENWQAEMRGFHTYNTLAERDEDAVRRKTLRHIAEAEAQHAAMWAKRIRELGAELPEVRRQNDGGRGHAGKPAGRSADGAAAAGDRREPRHCAVWAAAEGAGRRAERRDSEPGDRGRAGALSRAERADPAPLSENAGR